MQLQNLVSTLTEQHEAKKDYLINTNSLSLRDGILVFNDSDTVTYNPSVIFHEHLSEKLKIPKQYYDIMKVKAVNLLDENVNHWLRGLKKTMLVRTFDSYGNNGSIARAFLSSNYAVMDNYDVLFEALEAIKQTGLEVEIKDADISERRMYLKVVCPSIEVKANEMLKYYGKAVGVDMGVISGFVLSNSEVGEGSFNITPRAVVKVCNNGMVVATDSLKKVHLGGKMDELGFNQNLAIKAANAKLIKEQVKHAVKMFLSKQYLTKLVNVYTEMGAKEIEAPVTDVIAVVAKKYSITDERKAKILDHFIKQKDTRRIGIANALTEECQSLKDADLKNETEAISFEVMKDFSRIEAAAFNLRRSKN